MSQVSNVGVGIIIIKDDHVLLMKRNNFHGKGAWTTPGGYLDFGETPEQCAAREANEEVGLDVLDIRFRAITNDIFESTGKHFISIWMEGKSIGEPTIVADEEVAELGWFAWRALPQHLFLSFEIW